MKHTIIITVVSVLLVATMSIGGYFAYLEAKNTPKEVSEEIETPSLVASSASEIAKSLFKYAHISADNQQELALLVNSMSYIGFETDNINIDSGFLTVNYKVDSRTKYRFMDDYSKNFNQTCATLFVLVDGLKNVRLTVSDNYGEFYSFSRDNRSLLYTDILHNFTENDFSSAAENFHNFELFIEKLLLIKNDTENNIYLRQIYDVLSSNLQVVDGTKEQFVIALDSNNLSILSSVGINLYKHKNSSAELYFCNVEDYTINELKHYIFVFKDKALIAHNIISSQALYTDTIAFLK